MYPIVIDNFFEDPNSIRNYALSLNYQKPNKLNFEGWLGHRCFVRDEKFAKIFTNKINNYIQKNINVDRLEYTFHYSLTATKQTAPFNFDEYKIHSDSDDDLYCLSGLVYLHPNPPIKTGTSFYSEYDDNYEFSIENKYNRFICYPSNILHAPTDLFGDNKQNGRLTLTFFVLSNNPAG